MNTWKDSSNIVLVYYVPYAGGKFLIDALGFNSYCCPSINLYNNQTIADKISSAFSTIPPSVEECQNWLNYERSCGDFWGFSVDDLYENQRVIPDISESAQAILQDHCCFIVVHNPLHIEYLQKQLPNSKILELVNAERFIRIAREIKTKQPLGNYWPLLVHRGDFLFDVDTYFDYADFKRELERCCTWLNVPIEFDSRLEEFYQAYMALHVI